MLAGTRSLDTGADNDIGADLLSSQGHRVYMPDFLKGEYATADMFSGSEEYVPSMIQNLNFITLAPSQVTLYTRGVTRAQGNGGTERQREETNGMSRGTDVF